MRSYHDQINSITTELAETKRQAELVKQQLENIIGEKEKSVHQLQNEKSKLESRMLLLEEEFKNKKNAFEKKLQEHETVHNKDNVKLEQMRSELRYMNN